MDFSSLPAPQLSFTLNKELPPFTLNLATVSFIWCSSSSFTGEGSEQLLPLHPLHATGYGNLNLHWQKGQEPNRHHDLTLLSWHSGWGTWHKAFPDSSPNLILLTNSCTGLTYSSTYSSNLSSSVATTGCSGKSPKIWQAFLFYVLLASSNLYFQPDVAVSVMIPIPLLF